MKLRIFVSIVAAFALLGLSACSSDNTVDTVGDTGADTSQEDAADTDAGEGDSVDDTDADDTDDGSGDEPDGSGDGSGDEPIPNACPGEMCEIGGKCYDNLEQNPENPCEVCLVVVNSLDWSYDDTATCDDGDPCTVADSCFQGECIGTVEACDDGNPCTEGICDPDSGECSFFPVSGSCSDSDPCTVGDYCSAGVCVSGSGTLHCDDGNQCTTNRCEAGVGCVAIPLDGRDCDDGTACTTGDICVEGVCVGGEEHASCDDDNLCTANWCDPILGCRSEDISHLCATTNPCVVASCDPMRGCVYEPLDIACDDGDACTTNDWCVEGMCRGTAVNVDDGNQCTDDLCLPSGEIVHLFHTRACDDGNACTVGDSCMLGECIPGELPLDCDDGNLCTDDYCDPDQGCLNIDNYIPCDDGDLCTWGDMCENGVCVGRDTICADFNPCAAPFCNALTGGCDYVIFDTPECQATLTVTWPPRGATVLDDGSGYITVVGRIDSLAGGPFQVSANGELGWVDEEGNFTVGVPVENGGTILVVEGQDVFGSHDYVSQSFLFTDQYLLPGGTPAETLINEGMGLMLTNSGLGTLGSLLALALKHYDMSGAFPDPIAEEMGHKIHPRGDNPITFDDPSAALVARTSSNPSYPAQLQLTATIPNLRANLRISGSLCSGNVTYKASSLVITADLFMRVVDHHLESELENVKAKIHGGDISISCLLGGLIKLLVGNVDGKLEEAVEKALGGDVGALVAGAFDAFELSFDLDLPSLDPAGEPVPISLSTDFQRVVTNNDAMQMIQRTHVNADFEAPYDNLGMLVRRQCNYSPDVVGFMGINQVGVALTDNAINQLFYSAWRGGMFEFDVPPDMLEGVDLAAYGVSDLTLAISGMLAPTVSDCLMGGNARLHIGDLGIDASLNLMGLPIDAMIWVSLYATLEILAVDGEIGIAITGIEHVEVYAEVADPELRGMEGVLEDLIKDNLVPVLLDSLGGDALGSFPLPEFDISGSIDGIPAGTALKISPETVYRYMGANIVNAGIALVSP